jgi:hypothetical protein
MENNDLAKMLKRRSEIGENMKGLQSQLMALVKEREEIESKLTEFRDDFLKPLVEMNALLAQRKIDVEEMDKSIASRKNALNNILEEAKKKLDEMMPVKRARNE